MRYELFDITPPRPYSKMVMRGIDNNRRIAGYSYNSQDDAIRAVLWAGDRITELGTLGGRNSFANAISDKGLIVGYSELQAGLSTYRAFSYQAGFMDDLGTLGGERSTATAANNSGIIVGEAQRESGAYSAFVVLDGVMTALEGFGDMRSTAYAVNAAGIVAGQAHLTAKVGHAVIWAAGEMLDLGTLGGLNSCAMGINDRGCVVGWSQLRDGTCSAFLWCDRVMHELVGLGGDGSSARAINNEGVIVGTVGHPVSRIPIAACWIDGKAVNVNCHVEHAHGWTLKSPKAVNQCGDIIGEAMVSGLTQSFFIRCVADEMNDGDKPEKVVPETGRLRE